MPGAIGRAPALLPSRGGVIAHPKVQSRTSDSARCDWEIEEAAEAALLPVAPTLRSGKLDRPVKYRFFRRSNILAIRDHGVDARRAAEHAAAWLIAYPVVEGRLRHRGEGPVAPPRGYEQRGGNRYAAEHVVIRWAGLDEAHARVGACAQPAGEHRTCGSAADDDVVELHLCYSLCSFFRIATLDICCSTADGPLLMVSSDFCRSSTV